MNDILAKPVFDSWIDSLPELRGARTGERHLIYEGDGVFLDLSIGPLPRKAGKTPFFRIDGQILPADETLEDVARLPVTIELGSSRLLTETSALGEFSFRDVPPHESFDISIVLGQRRFLVRGLASSEPREWQVLVSSETGKIAKGGAQ